ncbi:MAG: DNA topoisomerase [Sulfurimonadaceae bacterium]|nr:DNA topoisomerase [Sulfurimonadaceae bacterium]
MKKELLKKIDSVFHETLLFPLKRAFIGSAGSTASMNEKYKATSRLSLSLHSLLALNYLVERELQIQEFESNEVVRIKADYIYNDIHFSAYYPVHFDRKMDKEITDILLELSSKKNPHIVDVYIPKQSEKRPPEPLTTAQLKFSAYYLYGFEPSYTTHLAGVLYEEGLITNPLTGGWNISLEAVEQIITELSVHFTDSQILQYKRNYSSREEDRGEECIRPLVFKAEYHPRNIEKTKEFKSCSFQNKQEYSDAKRLYEFIFYITLATQMQNSIYDTSSLEIVVGNKKLVASANSIVKGSEGWELLVGRLIQKISASSIQGEHYHAELPVSPQGATLNPLNITRYSYRKQRPPRYGVGRFLAQILENKKIGETQDHDGIIDELVSSQVVNVVQNMMHPQEISLFIITKIKEYFPELLTEEYKEEIREQVELIVAGQAREDEYLANLRSKITTLMSNMGFQAVDTIPSPAKIKLISIAAIKHGVTVDDSVFKSDAKADEFLAKHPLEEAKKIGVCIECSSSVEQKEYIDAKTGEVSSYFACEKSPKECTFIMWDNQIYEFFSKKAIELYSTEERADALKKILSKKRGYLFTGFIGKNNKSYDAKVKLDKYINRNGKEAWGLKLVF